MTINTFIHQKSYEHIVYQVRRHLITLVPTLLGFLVLLLLPVGLYWLLSNNFSTLLTDKRSYTALVLLGSGYLLSILLFSYTYFVTFYLDLLVVTNDRLLHIEQHGLFARTISEVDLFRIQDATSDVRGIIPSLFNYGTLTIQTAGAVDMFIKRNIPHPEELRRVILDLAEKDRKYHL